MCDSGYVLLEVSTGLVLGVALMAGSGPAGPVDVQWNKGSGPKQMGKGLPNPPGWYEAAVGPRSSQKVLYLTFDDGPAPATPRLLAALKKHGAQATFFVTGYAASQPGMVRRMHADGHAIGNHTWNHPRLTQVSTPVVRSELLRVRKAVGPRMGPCMRPPYGLVDERVARASIAAGFQPVLWTAHIEDWAPHSFAWTVDQLRKGTKPGAVILMHDTHTQTVAAVEKMLPRWKRQGYSLQTVPTCR